MKKFYRKELILILPLKWKPSRIPVVLSVEEVQRFLWHSHPSGKFLYQPETQSYLYFMLFRGLTGRGDLEFKVKRYWFWSNANSHSEQQRAERSVFNFVKKSITDFTSICKRVPTQWVSFWRARWRSIFIFFHTGANEAIQKAMRYHQESNTPHITP